MSFTLVDNETKLVEAGTYALDVDGACTISWDLVGEGVFHDIADATFTGASQVQISLPPCTIKNTSAGFNFATFALISK